jgi:hypothetical protein
MMLIGIKPHTPIKVIIYNSCRKMRMIVKNKKASNPTFSSNTSSSVCRTGLIQSNKPFPTCGGFLTLQKSLVTGMLAEISLDVA